MHQQGMLIRKGRICRAPPGDATTRLGPPNAHGSKCRYRTAWLAGSGQGWQGWQRAHSLVLLGMLADHVSDLSVGGARLADLNRLVQALQGGNGQSRAGGVRGNGSGAMAEGQWQRGNGSGAMAAGQAQAMIWGRLG